MIQNKDIIHILYDNGSKNAEIKLDEKERFIKNFRDIDLDITLVEILSKDNIQNYYFLNPELEQFDEDKLINSKIYIPYYPLEGKITSSESSIEKIDKNEFIYSIKTEQKQISSGNPIFLEKSINVIGIHKSNNNNNNYADFIYPILNILKKEFKSKSVENNKNKKIEYENGDYYIGEIENENGKPNGKGIKYFKDGNIYEGNFIQDKFDGLGKYYNADGYYYFGEWKQGLKYGKGTQYYMNGESYEGEFINNIPDGIGK